MPEKRFQKEIGAEYDLIKLGVPYYDEIQGFLGETLKDILRPNNSDEVLVYEIGFGSGITSQIMLESDSRIKLRAVDSEPLMHAQASERLATYIKDGRVNLFVSEALDDLRNQPNNSVDVVAQGYVLHNLHKTDREEIFKEIYRILKPGGIFLSADKIAQDDIQKHKEDHEWQVNQFNVYDQINRPEIKQQWIEHYEEDMKPDRAFTQEEFYSVLQKIGFKELSIKKRWHMDVVAIAIK